MRGRSILKWLIASVLISALSLLLLLAALPHLLKNGLNQWTPALLKQLDLGEGQLHIQHLSWRRLHLASFSLQQSNGSQIEVHDLTLQYRVSELIRGQLQRLELASIVMTLTDEQAEALQQQAGARAAQASEQVVSDTRLHIPLLSTWFDFPIQHIDVQRITLQHAQAQANVQLQLDDQRWRLWGDVQLSQLDQPWQLEMQVQRQGELLLMVSEQQQLLMQHYAIIRQNDAGETHLHLQQQIDTHAIAQQLDLPFVLPIRTVRIDSQIQLLADSLLPDDLAISSQWQFSSQPTTVMDELTWQQGDLQFILHKAAHEPWYVQLYNSDIALQWQQEESEHNSIVQLQIPASVLRLECSADIKQCHSQGAWTLHAQAEAQDSEATIQLSQHLDWQQDSALSVVLPLEITAKMAQHHARLTGELIGLLSPNGEWQLSSIEGFAATLQWHHDDWQGDALTAQIAPAFYVRGDHEHYQIEPLTIDIAPFSVQQIDAQLHVSATHLMCHPPLTNHQQSQWQCQLNGGFEQGQWQQWPLPDAQWQSDWQVPWPLTQLTANATLHIGQQQAQLRARLQHDIEQQQGQLQWHLDDTPLHWQRLGLPSMAALTRTQLLQGHMTGQGWFDWYFWQDQWQLKPDLMIRIDGLSAIYDNYLTLENSNTLMSIRRPLYGDYRIDSQFTAATLDLGIPLTHLLARAQLTLPPDFTYALLDVYEVNTQVLGGRVHAPHVRIDSRRDINAFGIELSNIQLAELSQIEAAADVHATGSLDGMLPIVLTPDGPTIPGGNLFARDPGGVVRYQTATSAALSGTDPTLNLAFQLLQDYRYQILETGVQYEPDGRLNLNLRFQGRNPSFFGGQASHLNLNLEYNLLDLLESLRISQQLIERVEQRYQ